VAPEETLPWPLPHDLRSEPFWRMNKYFTLQQVAVPGLWGLAWPPSHSLNRLRTCGQPELPPSPLHWYEMCVSVCVRKMSVGRSWGPHSQV